MDVKKGEDVALPCEAKGDPTPEVEWSKDDELLQSSKTQQSFLIRNAQLKDQGNYVCKAINQAGSVSYSLLVNVK